MLVFSSFLGHTAANMLLRPNNKSDQKVHFFGRFSSIFLTKSKYNLRQTTEKVKEDSYKMFSLLKLLDVIDT